MPTTSWLNRLNPSRSRRTHTEQKHHWAPAAMTTSHSNRAPSQSWRPLEPPLTPTHNTSNASHATGFGKPKPHHPFPQPSKLRQLLFCLSLPTPAFPARKDSTIKSIGSRPLPFNLRCSVWNSFAHCTPPVKLHPSRSQPVDPSTLENPCCRSF